MRKQTLHLLHCIRIIDLQPSWAHLLLLLSATFSTKWSQPSYIRLAELFWCGFLPEAYGADQTASNMTAIPLKIILSALSIIKLVRLSRIVYCYIQKSHEYTPPPFFTLYRYSMPKFSFFGIIALMCCTLVQF